MRTGYGLIDELAAGPLFARYCEAFPGAARDAGRMLRVAVQISRVERYEALLKRALRERAPVSDDEWHGLCRAVSWPRALPAWDRAPIEQWRLDWNPEATPGWPERYVGGCQIGPGSTLARPERRSAARVGVWWLKAIVVFTCTVVVGLSLPSFREADFSLAAAAYLLAVLVAAL